ncbi:syntaxin-12-like [Oscarella lobularis]|uniref:syntaxin-12-like n=1 Tax=Oscarella lobularis TaxID=121494 RepID=UPI0033134F14
MSRGDFGSQKYGEYGAVSSQESAGGNVELGFSTSETSYQSFETFRDYNERCQKVSNTVQSISAKTTQMEKLLKQVGTPTDAPELRRRLASLRNEVQHAVAETAGILKHLERDVRTPSGGLRKKDSLRFERLKSDYSDCVKRYQKALRGAMEAERVSLPAHTYTHHGSHLQGDEYGGDERSHLVEAERRRQEELDYLQKQEQVIDFHQGELEEREEAIKNIESDMVQCNEIFKDLGTMVHEQGDQIDLIEANITTTRGRVQDGTQQLRQAKEYQKKARSKMCCILIVILIVAAVLAIIIYFSVKK